MHLNVQSVRNKITDINLLLNENKIDFFCVTEHWLRHNEMKAYPLEGFYNASSYCREKRKDGGGAGIYVKDNINSTQMNYVNDLSVERVCELSAVYIKDLNSVLLVVYRSPEYNNYDEFSEIITKLSLCAKPNIKVQTSSWLVILTLTF